MRQEVFFIADDFGQDAQANAAIVAAHVTGALHGASLMMGQPATEEAVRMARDTPGLQIGWHLHLCDSKPVTRDAWPWARSHTRAGWAIGLSRSAWRLMRDETSAQWEMYQATGLPCAFVNSHHHLHAHPFVYAALLEVLPQPFDGWLRLGAPRFFSPMKGDWWMAAVDHAFMESRRRHCPHRCSDTIWGLGRLHRMQAQEVTGAMSHLPPGLHEFMFHPKAGTDDTDLRCLIDLKGMGIQ